MKVPLDRVNRLFKAVWATRDVEITCTDCFNLLDQFVDLQVAGTDPATNLSQVQQHLDVCPECFEEYQALLAVVYWDQTEGQGFPVA